MACVLPKKSRTVQDNVPVYRFCLLSVQRTMTVIYHLYLAYSSVNFPLPLLIVHTTPQKKPLEYTAYNCETQCLSVVHRPPSWTCTKLTTIAPLTVTFSSPQAKHLAGGRLFVNTCPLLLLYNLYRQFVGPGFHSKDTITR